MMSVPRPPDTLGGEEVAEEKKETGRSEERERKGTNG